MIYMPEHFEKDGKKKIGSALKVRPTLYTGVYTEMLFVEIGSAM